MMPKSVEIGDFVMWGYHFGLLGHLGADFSEGEKKYTILKILTIGRS